MTHLINTLVIDTKHGKHLHMDIETVPTNLVRSIADLSHQAIAGLEFVMRGVGNIGGCIVSAFCVVLLRVPS